MNHRRSVPWPLVALAAIAAGGARLGAQCVGDLQKETTALESLAVAIKEAAMKKPGEKGSYWKQYLDALGNEALYGQHLMKAGTATPCLLDRREAFRTAARTALVERVKDPEKLNDSNADDVAEALRSGAFTVLGSRYSPTDRFGVFFGFGASYIHQAHDARRYKVISQTETVTTPGANGQPSTQTSQTKQYIVEDSRSRSYPVGATGLTMRFRERNSSRGQGCFRMSGDPSAKGQSRNDGQKVVHSLAECVVWGAERLWPTAIFGSVQFGGGEGLVSGTTLGTGWKVVGDVNLLVGWGISRLPALRRDLRTEFEGAENGRLLLPTGENAESIMGTASQQTWLIALGIPLALRNALGGK